MRFYETFLFLCGFELMPLAAIPSEHNDEGVG